MGSTERHIHACVYTPHVRCTSTSRRTLHAIASFARLALSFLFIYMYTYTVAHAPRYQNVRHLRLHTSYSRPHLAATYLSGRPSVFHTANSLYSHSQPFFTQLTLCSDSSSVNGRSQRDSTSHGRWVPLTRSVCSVCSSARRRTGPLLQSTNATLKHDLLSHASTPSVPDTHNVFSERQEKLRHSTHLQKCTASAG